MLLYELNARAVDGSVLPTLEVPFAPTNTTLVVLIHGYNNTREAAQKGYDAFLQNATISVGTRDVCVLHWPGDKRWGKLSFGSYPLEIAPAQETGRILEAFFENIEARGQWPLRVILIAHSLGNRVALETVGAYVSSQRPRDIRFSICLMAAAVPVWFVELGGLLSGAAADLDSRLVLFSGSDLVLQFGFPIGETLAAEGFFPTAIGRHGDPTLLWGAGNCAGMQKANGDGFSHGDYWYEPKSAQMATDFVNGVPTSRPVIRSTPSNGLVTRELPVNDLISRSGPTGPSFL